MSKSTILTKKTPIFFKKKLRGPWYYPLPTPTSKPTPKKPIKIRVKVINAELCAKHVHDKKNTKMRKIEIRLFFDPLSNTKNYIKLGSTSLKNFSPDN